MKCRFQLIDGDATPKRYRCACGNVIASDKPPETFRASCRKPKAKPGPCVHLGAETRRVGCPTCQGTVQLKVFACAVHGECTLAKAKRLPDLKACKCVEYSSG